MRSVEGGEEEAPVVPRGVVPLAARVTTRIELPTRTILKVLLTLGVLWFLAAIWSILLLLFIATLLAAALWPVVAWLQRRGLPRPLSVTAVMVGLLAVSAGLLFLLIPPLIDEGQQFAKVLPHYVTTSPITRACSSKTSPSTTG